MAVLTDSNYGELRDRLYKPGEGKEDLKGLANLPTKAQLKAAFQVIEDFWTNNAAQLKADMQTALGTTITNALARKIGLAWLIWKVGKGG